MSRSRRRGAVCAQAEIGLALECDPLSAMALTAAGTISSASGGYEEALDRCRRAIDLQPDYGAAYYQCGLALMQMGRHEEADRELTAACRLRPDHPSPVAALAICRSWRGDVSGARALEDRIQQLAVEQASPLSLAELFANLGEHERALHYLEKAYQEHQVELIGIAVDPLFSPLRAHPDFQRVLRNIGLPASGDTYRSRTLRSESRPQRFAEPVLQIRENL